MPADNTVYDRVPCWDDHSILYTLHALTPVRFAYLRRILASWGIDPRMARLLDIGCGAGFLAERFARAGFAVTGIDPSASAIIEASAHGRRAALAIGYLVARGEAIPCPDATFDAVSCCDVLEHVNDLDRVIAESARVLKPGGLYLFDTINRTALSNLVVIQLFQEWRWSRFVDFAFHDWHAFITPRELRAILTRHGLRPGEMRGINPAHPLRVIRALLRLKRGVITFGDLEHAAPLTVKGPPLVLYAGYAVKRPRNPSAD